MSTVKCINSKNPKIFQHTFTKLEFLEKLYPLKDKMNCKHTTKVVVLYQVSTEIESKIQI